MVIQKNSTCRFFKIPARKYHENFRHFKLYNFRNQKKLFLQKVQKTTKKFLVTFTYLVNFKDYNFCNIEVHISLYFVLQKTFHFCTFSNTSFNIY